MYSVPGDTTSLVPGFPIRTSSDHSSVDSSPRPIAASHVLHRLLMPRHPPCALDNLTNTHIKKSRHKCAQKQKMLASTVQFSTTTRTSAQPRQPAKRALPVQRGCPLRTQQCANPTRTLPRTVGPVRCFHFSRATPSHTHNQLRVGTGALHHQRRDAQDTRLRTTPPPWCPVKLLRKEVIQPHLPVRLPCYDFVPIADPAFDGSLPRGVGPPASGVTDFRDVTGGVYKARERIHRSVADLRLLATPTSWGRVADPNPN